jgi:hypothetical protein
VRFVPEAAGFRVDGEQVDVEVDAPEPLAALARLERERVETALFPLQLDPAGAIRGASPAAQASSSTRRCARSCAGSSGGAPAAEREALRAFVDAVHRSAGELVTELPRDLFARRRPARGQPRDRAAGRRTGQVRMTFAARARPGHRADARARRELSPKSRATSRTVESWSLTPLDS